MNCRTIVLAVAFCGLDVGCALATPCAPPPAAVPHAAPYSAARRIVVISDLHLGVGRDANNQWSNLEDGRWAPEFALFLQKIDQDGHGATDLILNGDTFELWQSLELDCIHDDGNLGCTQDEELNRLHRVLIQHSQELASLKRFAESGNNHIVLVPGNHDAGLLYPAVQTAVLTAIGAPAERVKIASEGYWLSPDGIVYADHGQQIGQDANRFECWPNPFINEDGRRYLQRPWGEQFVQKFFNDRENRFPIIDNITDETLGIRLAAKTEGPATAGEFLDFVKFALFQVTGSQFVQSLGPEKKGQRWDVEAARRQGDVFIVDSLEPDDPFRPAVKDAVTKGALPFHTKDFTPDEIVAICDRRAVLKKQEEDRLSAAHVAPGAKATIPLCPVPMGYAAEQLFRLQAKNFRNYLELTAKDLQQTGTIAQPFKIYVYSHTHVAHPPFSVGGFERPWNVTVVNTGAWQRVVTKDQLDEIKSCRGLSDGQILPTLKPEDLPPCYSAVTLDPLPTGWSPHLVFWQQDPRGNWYQDKQCNWSCSSSVH